VVRFIDVGAQIGDGRRGFGLTHGKIFIGIIFKEGKRG
jgi:hypothetical protein